MTEVKIPYLDEEIRFRVFPCYTVVTMKELYEQEKPALIDKDLRHSLKRVTLKGKDFY